MRTVLLSFVASNLISLLVMRLLWKQNRARYAGLGFWLADFVLQLAAVVLLALRGVIPDLLSMTGSNTLVLGGTILILIGLERFVGVRGAQRHNVVGLAIFVAVHAYFVVIRPNLAARSILFSVALIGICAQCAWLLLHRAEPTMRRLGRETGLVFLGFCVVSLVRVGVDFAISPGEDLLKSNAYDTLLVVALQMLYIVLTFVLVLMVNRRLFTELDSDITKQARTDAIVRLRLSLWEYAAQHSTSELMQRALDEIEALTDSSIGFYHFVEEEQGTLTLQAWSTRTVRDFCRADGPGMHYPVDQAGVWVDCIRERAPVIHNDYASLPHRKGMPEGHAEVVRELVVPTLRTGRVVSVLGIGNKPKEYDAKDVELASYVAEVVWTIVEQKRAEEQILRLNAELEHLAMTDDLTKLANRRSFFLRGQEEVRRARRYHTPLAILMLDLDRFKTINDHHGHEAGDAALRSVAETLHASVREVDLVARIGGEEFAVLLPNTAAAEAVGLAERLRRTIESETCVLAAPRANVTASIGVATLSPSSEDLDALLRSADAAMYQAKSQGRNCVVVA